MMLGPRVHVVVAGETAMHEGLHEVTASALLGLVNTALPQHLRTDDGRRLFGEYGVPGEIMATGVGLGHQDRHPAFERLAEPDRAGHARPDAVMRPRDL